MQKKTSITLFLIAIAVAAFGALAAWWFMQSPVAKVKKEVSAQLVDPASAQFEDITVHASTGAACGLVNAKNRLGGYTGSKLFLLRSNGTVSFEPDEPLPSATTGEQIKLTEQRILFLTEVTKSCPGA